MSTFSEVVDAANGLSADEQEVLLELLAKRLAERRRAQLVRDVKEARNEFTQGASRTTSVSQIMDEAGDAT
jgi:hypothetical protein